MPQMLIFFAFSGILSSKAPKGRLPYFFQQVSQKISVRFPQKTVDLYGQLVKFMAKCPMECFLWDFFAFFVCICYYNIKT